MTNEFLWRALGWTPCDEESPASACCWAYGDLNDGSYFNRSASEMPDYENDDAAAGASALLEVTT